jgi:hypothetical protein
MLQNTNEQNRIAIAYITGARRKKLLVLYSLTLLTIRPIYAVKSFSLIYCGVVHKVSVCYTARLLDNYRHCSPGVHFYNLREVIM